MGTLAVSPPTIFATNTSDASPGPTPNDLANSGTTGTVAPMPKPSAIEGRCSWNSTTASERRVCCGAAAAGSGPPSAGVCVTRAAYTLR